VSASVATAETVVVRPRRVTQLAWAGSVLIVALFVAIAVVLRNTDTGVYFRFADQVSMVVMGLLFAAGLLLLTRPRVRADADGIEVRNIVVKRQLRWEDVEYIAFPDGASWARLDLPDDEYLAVLAVQSVDREHAVDGIRRLRALHSRARSRAGEERPTTGDAPDAPGATDGPAPA
jgi:hypothetical protein